MNAEDVARWVRRFHEAAQDVTTDHMLNADVDYMEELFMELEGCTAHLRELFCGPRD